MARHARAARMASDLAWPIIALIFTLAGIARIMVRSMRAEADRTKSISATPSRGSQMRVILDPDGDAAYFYLNEGISEVKTIWITEDLSVDLGPNEELVGLEVLSAARHLGLTRATKQMDIEFLPR
jgi:uncharacterized protein YuzE